MDGISSSLHSASTYEYSESSKTGSSKSAASVDKNKDRDFTKDNVASPIDLECQIQAERITKVLNEAVYKTKLALCLPNLVHEYKTLSSVLSSQHMDDLVFIFDQYDNPLFSASLLNIGAMDDIRAGDISLKNRLNPELGHLIYIMNSYPALKPKVEEMIEEMKLKSKMQKEKEPQLGLKYLYALEQFREQMEVQMNTTAAEELAAKVNTRKLEASNAKLIEKIEGYTKCLKEENEAFEESMVMKADMIVKLQHELAMLSHDANIRLKKQILDSERQMVLATRSHTVRNEMLKEEEIESREAYENMLHGHLVEEKTLRARRFKVETQLMSWLQKYDLEMGDKQAELDELTAKYDDEVRKCEELELKIAEQDKEYIPLMAEREAEYQQEMTEKMNKFLMEHAARVIQSAWREVVANRNEKKRLRKLLKKKQADDAAAASAKAAAAAAAAAAEKKAAALAKKEAAAARKAQKQAGAEGGPAADAEGTQTERDED